MPSIENDVAVLKEQMKANTNALKDNTEILHEIHMWIEADKAKRTLMKWALAISISIGAVLKGAYWNIQSAVDKEPLYYSDRNHQHKKQYKKEEVQ